MKMFYPLSMLLMSLCVAETPAKPEMTRNEFSERYEQMNHDALSLADVDFLQRASDTDFTKYISDTVGLTVIHLFYLSESKTPLSLADVNRDELHYLIQTDGDSLTLAYGMVHLLVEFVYRYDVKEQVYRRIKWNHADFRELVNREYLAWC